VLAELMVLRRWSTGSMTQNDLEDIGESLLALRDFGASADQVHAILARIAQQARGWSSAQLQMSLITAALVYPSDRYWTTVYLIADEIRRGRENWRSNELLLMLSAEMRFGELQMELATSDAKQLVERTRL
jgi:hypothetical protein